MLLVGFGLFSLFIRHEFHSAVVNSLAAGTLSVYLITAYPPVRVWLWQEMLPVRSLLDDWYALPAVFAVALAVMAVAFVLDAVRRLLFRFTVDRHRGHLFDRVWGRDMRSRLVRRLAAVGIDANAVCTS